MPTTLPPEIEADYEACRQLVRTHARNFYYGLRLSPEPKRSAVYAIYAWMRIGDDDIDLPGTPDEKKARLARFVSRSEAVFSGGVPDTPEHPGVWRAFSHAVRSFPIDHDDLRQLLLGLRDDLDHESASTPGQPVYASRDELAGYCYRVAGIVGLICLDIWGLKPETDRALARELAAKRGLAFQLTNILRDYGEDFDRGRVYLPLEDLQSAGLCPADLRQWTDHQRCAGTVRRIGNWARDCYRASAPLDKLIDPSCAPTLWAMTRIYSRLLEKIDADPRRVVSHRVRVRAIHKAGIAVAAALRARVHVLSF